MPLAGEAFLVRGNAEARPATARRAGVDFLACSVFVSDEQEPRLNAIDAHRGQKRRLLG